jgi:hypothetical protein
MATITVGCKLPNGLDMRIGDTIVSLKGFMRGANIIGGYGITENVDEAFFDEWLKRHAHLKVVQDVLVFKQPNIKEAAAQAKDTAKKKSGLEQIDPKEEKEVEKLKAD